MEHIIEKGIYGEGNIWRFYTVEEAEQHDTKSEIWKHNIGRMKEYLGKFWLDKNDILYYYNNEPRYRKYKIIGLEDNEPYCDYYWILEDETGKRKYELANYGDFYKNILT